MTSSSPGPAHGWRSAFARSSWRSTRRPDCRDLRGERPVALTVLLGGARSGKSRWAVRLATEADRPVTFIATGEPRDDEMAERIRRHRAERQPDWTTVEEPIDLA